METYGFNRTTSPATKSSFLRTESACSTLKIAKDLLRPMSEDSQSVQMAQSPMNQGPISTDEMIIAEEDPMA